MKSFKRNIDLSGIIQYFKVFSRKLPAYLLIALVIGFLFVLINLFSRERTIRSVRTKDAEIFKSVVETFIGQYTPSPDQWESIFMPLRPMGPNKKENGLFGIALWRNELLQYSNHDRLSRLSIKDMVDLAISDSRYSLEQIRNGGSYKWHIGFFRPELKYNFYMFDKKQESGIGYYLSPLKMIAVPVQMIFDPDMHIDMNWGSIRKVGMAPFMLGFCLVMTVFVFFLVKDRRYNNALAEKEIEKDAIKKEMEEYEKEHEANKKMMAVDQARQLDMKKVETQIDMLMKYVEKIDKDRLKCEYDDFIARQFNRIRIDSLPEGLNDSRLELHIRESSLFFILSDYVELFIESALPRYATMTEYCFRVIYNKAAKKAVEEFCREWVALSDKDKKQRRTNEFTEEALTERARMLGFHDSLRKSLPHLRDDLKNPDKLIIKHVNDDIITAGGYISLWLLPLFVFDLDYAKNYARPILCAIEYNKHLFDQINDLIFYRNSASHSREFFYESNSRQKLRMWHDQFIDVWSAVVKGYSE